MKLFLRRLWGAVARYLWPGYSTCMRCGRPWVVCCPHYTNYTMGRGCFPLCKECWGELTPETRLPFYRRLLDEWVRNDATKEKLWKDIEQAVLNGG